MEGGREGGKEGGGSKGWWGEGGEERREAINKNKSVELVEV